MKELTIEQKAKAYDKVLAMAKECLKDGTITSTATGYIETIFPELKESEDERIRKALIDLTYKVYTNTNYLTCEEQEKMLSWLEKQGEQKPAGKVEPKFREGDWVILTAGELSTTLQIVKVDTNKNLYWFNDSSYLPIVDEDCLHLWTIQDAKDGDLIYVSTEVKGIQAIFHKFKNGIIYFHCYLCGDFTQGGYEPSGDVEFVNPLQKTHYQKFFQKMKEAGYEWDADKKELKKL